MRANPTWILTLATLKMWFRDRQAIFWTLFLPLVLMVIFGILNFGAFGTVELGIIDQADNENSRDLVASLEAIDTFDISLSESQPEERQALLDGDRDLVLVIPASFGRLGETSAVEVLYNQGEPRETQV